MGWAFQGHLGCTGSLDKWVPGLRLYKKKKNKRHLPLG